MEEPVLGFSHSTLVVRITQARPFGLAAIMEPEDNRYAVIAQLLGEREEVKTELTAIDGRIDDLTTQIEVEKTKRQIVVESMTGVERKLDVSNFQGTLKHVSSMLMLKLTQDIGVCCQAQPSNHKCSRRHHRRWKYRERSIKNFLDLCSANGSRQPRCLKVVWSATLSFVQHVTQ